MKSHGRAGQSGKSRDRRGAIGGGGVAGEKSRDRRKVIGCVRVEGGMRVTRAQEQHKSWEGDKG